MKDFLEGAAALVAVIGAIAAWLKAAASLKEANAAKIAAKLADARADKAETRAQDALDTAKLATAALEGIKTFVEANMEFERAKHEAPALLETWIAKALHEGSDDETGFNKVYNHGPLTSLSEVLAAELAMKHERMHACTVGPYKIGMDYGLAVTRLPPSYMRG